MTRLALFLPLSLAACASLPTPLPPPQRPQAEPRPIVTDTRPVVAKDSLQGRWTITSVNGVKALGLWLELGGEGPGTVTRTGNSVFIGSPQPPTKAYLGCNWWHPNGWTRNGDKFRFSTEGSARTERGCDAARMALEDQAYAVLAKPMTMELTPPNRLRLVNEHGTLDLIRDPPAGR